jgi:hypothetical protein
MGTVVVCDLLRLTGGGRPLSLGRLSLLESDFLEELCGNRRPEGLRKAV